MLICRKKNTLCYSDFLINFQMNKIVQRQGFVEEVINSRYYLTLDLGHS